MLTLTAFLKDGNVNGRRVYQHDGNQNLQLVGIGRRITEDTWKEGGFWRASKRGGVLRTRQEGSSDLQAQS